MSKYKEIESFVEVEQAKKVAHKLMEFLENNKIDMLEAYCALLILKPHFEKVLEIQAVHMTHDPKDNLN